MHDKSTPCSDASDAPIRFLQSRQSRAGKTFSDVGGDLRTRYMVRSFREQ